MNWEKFKDKFHISWHPFMKTWVESSNSAKVYTYLKSRQGVEIAPKADLIFRVFEKIQVKNVKVVVFFEEPFHGKYNDVQYADGIAMSCDYVDKIHSHLNEFYNAMEKEFYGLNVNIIKDNHLDFLINQGVLFLNSSLSVEIGSPGIHKDLWVDFNGNLISNLFCKKNIPIIFCGSNIYEQYKSFLKIDSKYFVVKQPFSKWKLGTEWNTDYVFTKLNEHLDACQKEEIMWVNQDVPF